MLHQVRRTKATTVIRYRHRWSRHGAITLATPREIWKGPEHETWLGRKCSGASDRVSEAEEIVSVETFTRLDFPLLSLFIFLGMCIRSQRA